LIVAGIGAMPAGDCEIVTVSRRMSLLPFNPIERIAAAGTRRMKIDDNADDETCNEKLGGDRPLACRRAKTWHGC
jgi:hypothetical protein